MIYVTETISLATLIWTIEALVGIALSLHSARSAWQEMEARRATGLNGPLSLTARVLLRMAAAELLAYLLFFLLGSIVMIASDRRPPMNLTNVVAPWAFVTMEAAMLAGQVLNAIDRARIREEIAGRE